MSKMQPLEKEHYGYEPFSVADIEAPEWVNFLVIGLFDGTEFKYFTRLRDFFRYIAKHDTPQTIYMHFGGNFDFLHLLDYLVNCGTWNIIEIIPRGSGMLCLKVEHVQSGKVILFRDSIALLPFSLATLTETFPVKHKKLKADFEKMHELRDEDIKYLEHDCRGLHEVITHYFNWPLVAKSGPAPTVASQAMRILRMFISEEFVGIGGKVDEFVRRGYIAGRTEIFRPVFPPNPTDTRKLNCYDVNSLFPYCMSLEMPGNFQYWSRDYDPDEMGVWRATVDVPEDLYIPILGKKMKTKDGTEKLVFPTGIFSGTWTTAELEYAKTLGCRIVKTGLGAIFQNRGRVFAPYIDELYKLKEAAKPGTVNYVLAKLLLNSSYGRFGIRRDKEKLVFDDGREGFQEIREFNLRGKTVCLGRIPTEYNGFANVAIAMWITALARIHMHRQMAEIDFDVYYTDTDSLFTPRELPHGEGLGKMKLEYTCDSAVFLLPKTYCVDGLSGEKKKKIRMKGIDRKAADAFTLADFRAALDGTHRLTAVVSPRFATLRSAIKTGKLVTMLPGGKKTIKAVYSKRVLIENSDGWDSRSIKLTGKKTINGSTKRKPKRSKKSKPYRLEKGDRSLPGTRDRI